MWPQTILVRGIPILVNSWEDFDELVRRYGSDSASIVLPEGEAGNARPPFKSGGGGARLAVHDKTLLRRFVEDGSVSTNQIGQALGKKGKAIKNGLNDWSRKIGLTSDATTVAFEPCFRADGRGYRLTNHFSQVARGMLEEQG